jgi:hypothetical protein
MDKLSINGWAWEFLRRNKKYIDALNKLEQAVKSGNWNDKCEMILSKLKRLVSPTGLLIERISGNECAANRGKFLTLKLPYYKGDEADYHLELMIESFY